MSYILYQMYIPIELKRGVWRRALWSGLVLYFRL